MAYKRTPEERTYHRKWMAEKRAKDPAKARANWRVWYAKRMANLETAALQRERYRWNTIKYKYGLTKQDWEDLLAKQGGACACCGTYEPRGRNNQWHTDHDHETGQIRGLLCYQCNLMIGRLGDTSKAVRAATDQIQKYLQRHAYEPGSSAGLLF